MLYCGTENVSRYKIYKNNSAKYRRRLRMMLLEVLKFFIKSLNINPKRLIR